MTTQNRIDSLPRVLNVDAWHDGEFEDFHLTLWASPHSWTAAYVYSEEDGTDLNVGVQGEDGITRFQPASASHPSLAEACSDLYKLLESAGLIKGTPTP